MPKEPCAVCDGCKRGAGHAGRCDCGHPCDVVQGFCYHHRMYERDER